MRALLIEDDRAARRLAEMVLTEAGFVVDATAHGDDGLLLGSVNAYDLIVLDLGLPDRAGECVLRDLRRSGCAAPIIVLTGRSAEAQVVQALDAGADDYLVKPVSNALLRARVRAAVRRGGAKRLDELAVGALVVNRRTRQALVRGCPLALTPRELALLEELALHAGEVVTRSALLERLWDANFDPSSNVIEAHVARLRRKLVAAHAEGTRIVTVPRAGYMLLPPAGPADA
jgi:DNA-binding response OmpR family regulator